MTKEETLREINTHGGFYLKPSNWEDVGLPLSQKVLESLKQYSAADLGIADDIAGEFTKDPAETIFLVGRNGGLYLVNTEGYDYARCVRYVGQTVDKPVPDTLEYVLQAFDNNGYNMRGPQPGCPSATDGLSAATFVGISSAGKEMYRVTFTNVDGEPDKAVAYVWKKDGKKVADF